MVYLTLVFEPVLTATTSGGKLQDLKPNCTHNKRQHSFVCFHVNCWNELLDSICNSHPLSSGKRHVSNYDFSKSLITY